MGGLRRYPAIVSERVFKSLKCALFLEKVLFIIAALFSEKNTVSGKRHHQSLPWARNVSVKLSTTQI